MSKAKAVVAALAVVMVLGAVGASTASAGEWFVNGAKITKAVSAANTAAVMENYKMNFSGTEIECTGVNLESGSPQIEPTDKVSTTGLTFVSCATSAGSSCQISGQPVNARSVPLAGLAETSGAEVVATFVPKTKSTFMTVQFTGISCALSGVQTVTGKLKMTAPTGQAENTLQELIANTVSGELKVGTNAATLKGKALLKLLSGERWSFH